MLPIWEKDIIYVYLCVLCGLWVFVFICANPLWSICCIFFNTFYFICLSVCKCIYMYVHIHIYLYRCMCGFICVYMYIIYILFLYFYFHFYFILFYLFLILIANNLLHCFLSTKIQCVFFIHKYSLI